VKYLITGGSGYLGGRLVDYLQKCGEDVTIASRKEPGSFAVDTVKIDYSDLGSMIQQVAGFQCIIHLAYPDEIEAVREPGEALRAGSENTWNLCQAISSLADRPLLIYLSTFHVYGKNAKDHITEDIRPLPIHPYALGKYYGEMVVQLFCENNSLKGLCVRLSNAFGVPHTLNITRWSLVFNDLCRQAIVKKQIKLKSAGLQKRNFITLDDTVRALDFLAKHHSEWPQDGILNMGSTINLSILEVAEIVASRTECLFGYKPMIVIPELAKNEYANNSDFYYSSARLQRMGFIWRNSIENEVDATLKLIMEAKDEHSFF